MTAKDFLDRAYKLELRFNSLLQQKESLRPPSEQEIHEHDAHDRIAAKIANIRLQEIEAALCVVIDKMVDSRREIMNIIDEVGHERYRQILRERYLYFSSWDKIASDLNIRRPWALAQHRRALAAVETLLLKKGLIQESECTN